MVSDLLKAFIHYFLPFSLRCAIINLFLAFIFVENYESQFFPVLQD
jgi:hypothetical protein